MNRTVFSSEGKERRPEHEPIRGSIFIFIARLLSLLLLFESLYIVVYYILALGIPLPFDLHHHVTLVLFITAIIKIVIQLYLILHVTLSWANNAYYLVGQEIIQRKGIFRTEENVFLFKNIQSISINQSFLGKLFNYGDITLKTSASEGFPRDVMMVNISNPKKYEEILREYF